MGRHSRRGRAGKTDTSEIPVVPAPSAVPEPEEVRIPAPGRGPGPVPGAGSGRVPGGGSGPVLGGGSGPVPGAGSGPGFVHRGATPPPGALGPYPPAGVTPPRGVPRYPDGTPAHGIPRMAEGTPAHGVPRFADGTPAGGVPRFPDGTPAGGVPRFPDGTPVGGVPRVRGGHPEQREAGGGWGESRSGGVPQGAPAGAPVPPGPRIPRQRREPAQGGPRQAYVDAFDLDEDDDVFAPRGTAPGGTAPHRERVAPGTDETPLPESEEPAKGKGGKGRAFTGIAAAAVTTVLAVVVAGQVVTGRQDADASARSAGGSGRETHDSASRGDGRPAQSGTPTATTATTLTYDQKMGKRYALGATLAGSGKFDAVLGFDKAPGKGRKYTYRVDVEQGMGLDAQLFAQAVQKTLNDDRSWAHNGGRTFERISSGKPDFVITLATPGTTATWCAKSGLDTTEDNVSCDSASTDRVMINAYRWAQGSTTYGDRIHAYRQMLINHEVGHRLGYGHVTCDKDGELAPVMQQQTKFLDHDGIHCRANPWPYPES
ncbi:DUF3152 domain-containing protein [Streptomyces sp. NPDC058246]|uniref:DUF3152 domain-containing protein n=1 Tax=Streptomyces sp. NPDC058246 TaxID=3346400 RepID=UPI0036E53263